MRNDPDESGRDGPKVDRAKGVPGLDIGDAHVVRLVKGGPALVEGPVRIVQRDGSETTSDRVVVAVCRCRRSALYPLCDTSHRNIRSN